jgi:tetratricopeptide (TPR) repeat protein
MTAVSLLDDQTAAAIREAVVAARSGRIPDAVRIGERALANGGDTAALNAMIGTFQCQVGNLGAGIRHLQIAHKARPLDPVIASNLATALSQNGDYAAALKVLPYEVAVTDQTMQLLRLRAFAAQMVEELDIAIESYKRIVDAQPDDWESWNNLGNTLRLADDVEGSVAALARAVELNPDSAPVRLNHAMAMAKAGNVKAAERELRQLADDFPADVKALSELHSIYKELGREDDALWAIEAAVNRDPRNVELLLGLASHLLSMLRTDKAEETYRKVVEIQPDNGLANLGLALAFELTNRGEELSRLVKDAAERGVPSNAQLFIQAFDHRRAKRFAEGLEAMKQVPEELETARRWHLLGQLHEGVGNYDDAFEAFKRMNDIQLDEPTNPEERASNYRSTIKSQQDSVTPGWLGRWRDAAIDDGRETPVFLVGFPRSGTTLLDTILMSHPGTEVLEEEPTLSNASRLLPAFEDIPSASEDQVRAARDKYFEVASNFVPLAPGKLLVDKNPLSMNALPIIRRLFPDAQVILALRHPCDVVLSCYATNFKLNDGMSSFLRLETAAELYDLSFRYFEKASALLKLPTLRIRYENIVADRERELRSLLDFLSLEWHDDVLHHQATALSRGRIKTASYAQVAQPIYSQAAGRWTNFRKHLEPVLPVLEPWIAKFGYSL